MLVGQVSQTAESDLGPRECDPRKGMIVIGAVPYVVNYNIRLLTQNK